MGRKTKSKTIDKDKVLKIASKLFSKHGISRTPIPLIAKETDDVVPGTIYNLFPGGDVKEQMVLTLLKKQYEEECIGLRKLKNRAEDPIDDVIIKWLDDLAERYSTPSNKGRLPISALVEYSENHRVHKRARLFYKELAEAIEHVLRSGPGRGSPETLALKIAMVVDGARLSGQWKEAKDAVADIARRPDHMAL